jgi:ribonuclease HII
MVIELKVISQYPQEIIAIDEVGRSPLSGPVVIGALRIFVNEAKSLATLLRSLRRQGVKDSKLLNSTKRGEILSHLGIELPEFRKKASFHWKGLELSYVTWEMDHLVIDQENILNATLRGMKEAAQFLSLQDKRFTTLLIDGQLKLRWAQEPPPWREIPIVKGDEKSPLIGLAAIIAKEKRDSWMRQMHLIYPHYGFDRNVGYPTREHRQAISLHGPCPIHRLSFNKLKEFITAKEV